MVRKPVNKVLEETTAITNKVRTFPLFWQDFHIISAAKSSHIETNFLPNNTWDE